MFTMNKKSGVSEEQNERHKRVLAACMREPTNRSCADCGLRNPTWCARMRAHACPCVPMRAHADCPCVPMHRSCADCGLRNPTWSHHPPRLHTQGEREPRRLHLPLLLRRPPLPGRAHQPGGVHVARCGATIVRSAGSGAAVHAAMPCTHCSAAHAPPAPHAPRAARMGMHLSQVRSCNLDTWLPKQVDAVRALGNARSNRYWEASLPQGFRRPPSGNPNPELVAFIRDKYEHRRYATRDVEPPTIENYTTHPYAASAAAPAAPAPAPAPAAAAAPKPAAHVASPMDDLLGSFDVVPMQRPPPAPVQQQQPPPVAAGLAPSSGGLLDDDWGTFTAAPAAAPAAAAPHHRAHSQSEAAPTHDPFAVLGGVGGLSLGAPTRSEPAASSSSDGTGGGAAGMGSALGGGAGHNHHSANGVNAHGGLPPGMHTVASVSSVHTQVAPVARQQADDIMALFDAAPPRAPAATAAQQQPQQHAPPIGTRPSDDDFGDFFGASSSSGTAAAPQQQQQQQQNGDVCMFAGLSVHSPAKAAPPVPAPAPRGSDLLGDLF
jgi:hypothetical protein